MPFLQLDDAEYLGEGPVIVQYLGDLKPAPGVLQLAGTRARYRPQAWLAFINSQLRKNYGPMFNRASTPEQRQAALANLQRRFAIAEAQLAKQEWLVSNKFSAAKQAAMLAEGIMKS